RERDRRCIGAAAAESRDATAGCNTLETGNHRNLARSHGGIERCRRDRRDARLAMGIIGLDRHLPAEEGTRLHAELAQGEGSETSGHLLARGNNRVVFPLIRQPAETVGPGDELVGDARHGRDDDCDLMAGIGFAFDAARDGFDPLDIGDRCAAEFLHDARHTPRHLFGAPKRADLHLMRLADNRWGDNRIAGACRPIHTPSREGNHSKAIGSKKWPRIEGPPSIPRKSSASPRSRPNGAMRTAPFAPSTTSTRRASNMFAIGWPPISIATSKPARLSPASACSILAAAAGCSASPWRGLALP